MNLRGGITLFSGEHTEVEIVDTSKYSSERNIYCCFDITQLTEFSTPIAIHFQMRYPEEKLNDSTTENGPWHGWISITNYSKLVTRLNELTFDEHDNVNTNEIAYTNCTGLGVCLVCDTEIPYLYDDVISFCHTKGPIYVHKKCVSKLSETIESIPRTYATELLSWEI